MASRTAQLFILLLLQLLIYSLYTSETAYAQSDTEIESKIHNYLQPYLEMDAWSGVVMISKEGEPQFQRAYGLADREWGIPNTIDTKFRIASISKLFTQVTILQLAESGNIGLDDPLSQFIPDYPRGNEITIRHLLNHRSGIININSFPNYGDLIKFDYEIADVIELFKNEPLEFPPGDQYSYSNSGYALLAYIVETVSGSSFETYLKETIFDVYDLTSTGVDHNDHILSKRANGYMFDYTGELMNAEFVSMSIKTGGGSLYSTVGDLHHFLNNLLQGEILTTGLNDLPNFSDEENAVFTVNGRVQGFCHQITHRMENDVTVMVLGNHYSNIALPISDDIYRIYTGQPYEQPKNYFAMSRDVSSEVLQTYEGTYDFGFGPVGEVRVIDSNLTYLAPGREIADRLIPLGDHRFFYPQSWVLLQFRDPKNNSYETLDWIMGANAYPARRINP